MCCWINSISLLLGRATHTRRHACTLDARLGVLHPGIEPWLEEHGHVSAWHKTWGRLVDDDGTLTVPMSYSGAYVGNSGATGVPLLTPHTCARLSLSSTLVPYRGPLPPPCPTRVRVCVRFSVGVALGK